MTEPNSQTIRIGELMIKAGFLSDQDLTEALEIAKDSGQRIGSVLVMSGFVSSKQLQAALLAQEQLREGRITLDDAARSLRASSSN
jgi:type IV pilus assembly protein PilB